MLHTCYAERSIKGSMQYNELRNHTLGSTVATCVTVPLPVGSLALLATVCRPSAPRTECQWPFATIFVSPFGRGARRKRALQSSSHDRPVVLGGFFVKHIGPHFVHEECQRMQEHLASDKHVVRGRAFGGKT